MKNFRVGQGFEFPVGEVFCVGGKDGGPIWWGVHRAFISGV